jgi:hypothetical protein
VNISVAIAVIDEVSEFSDPRIPDKRSSDHSRANSAMTPVK